MIGFDKDFIKQYTLNELEVSDENNVINVLNQNEYTSVNFGQSCVQAGEYTIFYKNTDSGIVFYIYDRNMELLKTETIKTHYIEVINNIIKQDEDGNFYLVGNIRLNGTSTTNMALILLNNIVSDNAIVRKWYPFSKIGIGTSETLLDCQKREGSADYLFFCHTGSGSATVDTVLWAYQFNVSVENGNSTLIWKLENYKTDINATVDNIGYLYNQEISKVLIIIKGNTTIQVILLNLDNNWKSDEVNTLDNENGIEVNKTLNEIAQTLKQKHSIIVNGISNFVFIGIEDDGYCLIQYNVASNYVKKYFSSTISSTQKTFILNNFYVGYLESYMLDLDNYSNFVRINQYELTQDAIIVSNDYLQFDFLTNYSTLENLENISFIKTNIYNLNYITLVLVDQVEDGKAIIVTTDNSKNGFKDYNELIPDYVNLRNNGNVIFSRKILNKNIIANQMNAEVNIPANMLNDITIDAEELVSQTLYGSLETKEINKNIYESLYLNFIKYINVIDNNFGKNELQNEISALLTESVYDTKAKAQKNYNEKAPIFYVKFINRDGQEQLFSIAKSSITQTSADEYLITIAVNSNITEKIQIMAKDKQTAYVTIPLQNINKIIVIKQVLRYEEV